MLTPISRQMETQALLEFDEGWYLDTYKDVAQAVREGLWQSGYMHYCVLGKTKGRCGAPDIAEDWYSTTYPLVALEIAAGKASSPREHYFKIGRFRGYLPNQKAQRPNNSGGFRSRFGGLWTDQLNALDLVEGRRELGMITDEQAGLLKSWISDGYVILHGAIPEPLIASALHEIDAAYGGDYPDVRFNIAGIGRNQLWSPDVQKGPAKALDLHWFSEPLRELIFAPKVLEFLHLLFERRALATQSLAFWRGSAQDGHQYSAYVNYSLPMQFAASWIALEDVREGAGELFYHVGSHRMAEFLYLEKYKGVEEAFRLEGQSNDVSRQINKHVGQIALQAQGLGLETKRLLASRGDVLFWAADLAHGGRPISNAQTRKSIVTHYCPAELVPSYFETGRHNSNVLSHRGMAFYASSHYGNSAEG